LKLLLRGSAFQLKVWEALLAIPSGEIRSYQEVAAGLGDPAATRAVASAIARNSIGYLIPCHRVIRASGEFSRYRWGGERKQAMIAREAGMAGVEV
jgi:AraC family transcriptional regulator of adaptative response/methylated-DNA-[protein]-cysteine methyltransferase